MYTVWDLDCDDPGIIGLFETKDEADAHAAYATHKYYRAMIYDWMNNACKTN